MFESLSERLSGVFDRLTKQGALSEDDVKTALREAAESAANASRDRRPKIEDKPKAGVVKNTYSAWVDVNGSSLNWSTGFFFGAGFLAACFFFGAGFFEAIIRPKT